MNNKIKIVLRLFRNRIPCKSKYLPKALNISKINDRKTEIMVHYCKVLLNIKKKFYVIFIYHIYNSNINNLLTGKMFREYNI